MEFNIEKVNEDYNRIMKTPNAMQEIHKELLKLKTKISEILLYDTETAVIFLQDYNKILQNANDNSIQEILKEYVDLKFKISDYEKGEGRAKRIEDESRVIVNQLEDLELNSEQMTIEEFESTFISLRQIYDENIGEYDLEDKDAIMHKIAKVQAKLIIRNVAENEEIDLHELISKEDEQILTIAIYDNIQILMQDDSQTVQDIVNRVKLRNIDKTDIVYDKEIWKLLNLNRDSKQQSKSKNEKKQPKQLLLDLEEESESQKLFPELKKEPIRLKTPSIFTLFNKGTLRIGNKSMKVSKTVKLGDSEIDVRDLAKINIDWLAEQVPREMLLDIEREYIVENDNTHRKNLYNEDAIYISDGKKVIYNMFNEKNEESLKEKYININFTSEQGNVLFLHLCFSTVYDSSINISVDGNKNRDFEIDMINDDDVMVMKNIILTLKYAEFIDELIGSNLRQLVSNEIGVFYMKIIEICKECDNEKVIRKAKSQVNKLPILNNLEENFYKLKKYCESTKLDYVAGEQQRRREYYERRDAEEAKRIEEISKRKDLLLVGMKVMKVCEKVQMANGQIMDVEELAKIDMDFLANQMPQQMLIEEELEKLSYQEKKEYSEGGLQIYMPSSKTPIYKFFKESNDKIKDFMGFKNEKGDTSYLRLSDSYNYNWNESCIELKADENSKPQDVAVISHCTRKKVSNLIKYAEIIDKIIESNLRQQLLDEIGSFYTTIAMHNWGIIEEEDKELINELPIFSNLHISYSNLAGYCIETERNFEYNERENRKEFYKEKDKKKEFRQEIRDMAKLDESKRREEANYGSFKKIPKKRESKNDLDGIE